MFNHLLSLIVFSAYIFLIFQFIKKQDIEKVSHALTSSLNTILMLIVLGMANNDLWTISILSSLVIGIGREITQIVFKEKRRISFLNLVADLVGSIIIADIYIYSFLL
jgi:hypothetical protein